MNETEREIRAFLDSHEARLRELVAEAHTAYWESATTGDPEAANRYARADAETKKLYSRRADAERVRGWLEADAVSDPLLRRQLVLLDLEYTANLLPEATIDDLSRRTAELEQTLHTFRAEFEGERVSNNQLVDVLREDADSSRRRAAWEASKTVAREVAEPLRELVRRRNDAARSLGFADYYSMALTLQEQDETRLFELLDTFKRQSEAPFRALRDELDRALGARFGVAPEELRPWHWEDFFAQEAPSVGRVDLDTFFEEPDLLDTAERFFQGIGLPVDDVLRRSDMFEREGKSQHAFCIDIDRAGDVRVLCNMRPTEHWAKVLLHELGHAVYDKFIPRALPFVVRQPAHTLSTESIAMLMGRLSRDPLWLRDNVGADLDADAVEDIRRQLRTQMLVAARWIPVMVYFERELYRDPDREDLNRLWWDLVEDWQLVRRPDDRDEPDWASKMHFSSAPVYYHNYLLGELMASQLTAYIEREIIPGEMGTLSGNPAVGMYLKERVFAPGRTLDWNSLLVEATGEGLNPGHFVEQFVT